MQLKHITISKKPFSFFREHTHEVWEIIRINDGEGIEIVDGVKYEVHKGSILCIPAGVAHSSYSSFGMCDSCAGIEDFPSDISSRILFLNDDSKASINFLLNKLYDAVIYPPQIVLH